MGNSFFKVKSYFFVKSFEGSMEVEAEAEAVVSTITAYRQLKWIKVSLKPCILYRRKLNVDLLGSHWDHVMAILGPC